MQNVLYVSLLKNKLINSMSCVYDAFWFPLRNNAIFILFNNNKFRCKFTTILAVKWTIKSSNYIKDTFNYGLLIIMIDIKVNTHSIYDSKGDCSLFLIKECIHTFFFQIRVIVHDFFFSKACRTRYFFKGCYIRKLFC